MEQHRQLQSSLPRHPFQLLRDCQRAAPHNVEKKSASSSTHGHRPLSLLHLSTSVSVQNKLLKKILQHLDDDSLFTCRQVNRKLNELATSVLKERPSLEMEFWFVKKTFLFSDGKRSLQDFTSCCNQSKNFPYSRFVFRNIKSLDSAEHLNHFLFQCSDSIKSLKLGFAKIVEKDVERKTMDVQMKDRAEKLKTLISSLGPNCQEFGLSFDRQETSVVKLFSSDSCSSLDSSDNSLLGCISNKRIKREKVETFPYIRVLHLGEPCHNHYGIIKDLLSACVNLRRVQSFSSVDLVMEPEDLDLFHAAKKLHFVSSAEIHINSDLATLFKGNKNRALRTAPPPNFRFRLKEVAIEVDKEIHQTRALWGGAGGFISHVYESSKDSLVKLTSNATGFLGTFVRYPDEFPRLKQIEALADFVIVAPLFPPNISLKSKDIFAHVETINFGKCANAVDAYFPKKNLTAPYIPTVHTLIVEGANISGASVEALSFMFPNLKKFSHGGALGSPGLFDFPSFGRGVWKHMTKLEVLAIKICMESEKNSIFPALDSTLTGISKENCRRLFTELPDEAEAATITNNLKESKSIVDLPFLKWLDIQLKFPKVLDLDAEKFDRRAGKVRTITKVSELCAFQFMAQANFAYRVTNICDLTCLKNWTLDTQEQISNFGRGAEGETEL